MFGKSVDKLPVILEDAIRANGAAYVKTGPMLPLLVSDRRFITGQNPYSTTLVAEAVVNALGISPVERMFYSDENSMQLVDSVLKGGWKAGKLELEQNTNKYDMELIAVYGYYKAMHSEEDRSSLSDAISIMELVTPYYFHQDLYYALANYHLKMNNKDKAREIINIVLTKVPDHKASKEFLQKID